MTVLPSADVLDRFRAEVRLRGIELYRDMPWRGVDDAYAVLVSEVMLQQTQVARVVPRYGAWLDAFPTTGALAAAPLAAVLEQWQGLGYNRRAVALKRTAEEVVQRFGGVLPDDTEVLRTLPGIGPATAAAVVNYAYRIPAAFIETNVRAVFLHHFFADASRVPDGELRPIVEATWDRDETRAWGYALMDYGTWLKASTPNPSRRSSHHVRQSPFEGSHRQKRAGMLRAVLREPGMSADAYAVEAGLDAGETLGLLEELAGEGFLELVDGRWLVGA